MDFNAFEKHAKKFISNYAHLKRVELNRLGNILKANIIKSITEVGAVDTGNLRKGASWFVEILDDDVVLVATNVEYAQFVNDGHYHFWRLIGGVPVTISRREFETNQQGVQGKNWVVGRKYLEKAIKNAEPKLKKDIEKFMEELRVVWDD